MRAVAFISEHGYHIDWLRWLLTEGDRIIIADYRFSPGPHAGSRTGLGVMKKGGVWSVPSRFAGTYKDNWLSRALATLEEPLAKLIIEEFRRAL